MSRPSSTSASAPTSKSLFSSLVALAATSESKSASVPSDLVSPPISTISSSSSSSSCQLTGLPLQRNIIITTHPSLHATTATTATNNKTFTVNNPSSALLDLLAKAPASFSFSDQIRYPRLEDGKPGTIKKAGKPRFQPGIWLDDLPMGLRPALTDAAPLLPPPPPPPPAAPTAATPRKRRQPTSKRKRTSPAAKAEEEKKKKEKGEPKQKKAPSHHSALDRAASAPASSATTQEQGPSTEDAPSLAGPAKTGRPKGLEIDMVAGTFLLAAAGGGGRGSRVRKRPARFEDGVEGDGDGGKGGKKARTV
ncbi:MAG: hypothetical protein LQ350_000096 [Teloschistes chrysophthalmus]|nr:MAG: hypothetical protein LQ350_000096 [Niorma chrysophthalma]